MTSSACFAGVIDSGKNTEINKYLYEYSKKIEIASRNVYQV